MNEEIITQAAEVIGSFLDPFDARDAAKALVKAGLLPTETEWAIWRSWDGKYFLQTSEEAARGGSAQVEGFLTASRLVTPWKTEPRE